MNIYFSLDNFISNYPIRAFPPLFEDMTSKIILHKLFYTIKILPSVISQTENWKDRKRIYTLKVAKFDTSIYIFNILVGKPIFLHSKRFKMSRMV